MRFLYPLNVMYGTRYFRCNSHTQPLQFIPFENAVLLFIDENLLYLIFIFVEKEEFFQLIHANEGIAIIYTIVEHEYITEVEKRLMAASKRTS